MKPRPPSSQFKSQRRPEQNSSRETPADWIFGPNAVRELLRAGRRKAHEILVAGNAERFCEEDPVFAKARARGVRFSSCERGRLDNLSATLPHQNVAARVAPYPYGNWDENLSTLKERELFLLLDSVQDPQNFGTLCRSAVAFGVGAVILPKDRSVAVTAAVCRASSGAVEHLKIIQVVNLARAMEELKAAGFWIYGTSLTEESVALNKIDPAPRSALVLGSEGEGMRPLIAKNCDVLVKIPMAADFDSLNVAQAGTVCLYEFGTRGTR